jgi:hypothetical protein
MRHLNAIFTRSIDPRVNCEAGSSMLVPHAPCGEYFPLVLGFDLLAPARKKYSVFRSQTFREILSVGMLLARVVISMQEFDERRSHIQIMDVAEEGFVPPG